MLEPKLGSRCVILKLKRAVERTNRTDIAIAIQQRIAKRASSFVCGFHKPWLGFQPAPSSANRARAYTGFGWLGIFECGCTHQRVICLQAENARAFETRASYPLRTSL